MKAVGGGRGFSKGWGGSGLRPLIGVKTGNRMYSTVQYILHMQLCKQILSSRLIKPVIIGMYLHTDSNLIVPVR